MGDNVKIKEIETGDVSEFLVVGTTESNVLSEPMKISNESPV
jgi:transcription elongation GreA/GreB family factor